MDINSEFNACMYRDKCRENVATIETLRQQLTKPADEVLIEAAKAVVERWETPLWKDADATAGYIYRLRDALNAYKPADHIVDVNKMVPAESVEVLLEALQSMIDNFKYMETAFNEDLFNRARMALATYKPTEG
jgi:hypothetical protein